MSLAVYLVFMALVPLESVDFTNANKETHVDLDWAIRQQEGLEAAGGPVPTLSRRRRFLVYPEGSSLQLVFCLTYPTTVLIGDIFLMGATTALAWQLPQDPYSPFDHHADPLHRSDNVKNIYYTNEGGHVYSVKPLKKKKILINPAMAKRSIDDDVQMKLDREIIVDDEPQTSPTESNPKQMKLDRDIIGDDEPQTSPTESQPQKMKLDREIIDDDELQTSQTESQPQQMKLDKERMHKLQQRRDYLKTEFMDEKAVHFHRLSRKDLYPKIEVFLNTLGHDGRSCVLKTLCQMGKDYHAEQGTFLDEIMRAIFTLPKGEMFTSATHAAYDRAHAGHDSIGCEDLYPDCPASVTDIPMR